MSSQLKVVFINLSLNFITKKSSVFEKESTEVLREKIQLSVYKDVDKIYC